MHDLRSKTILVTGATDGIGALTAGELARRGATVILHGRREERCQATLAEIRRSTPDARLDHVVADFAALDEVRRMAGEVTARHPALDVLLNNAGVGAGKPDTTDRELSRDGHELRFAVNHLAPFLLTRLLVPCLERGAPARVVNVASAGQSPIDFDDVMFERDYQGLLAYRKSKLAMVMATIELARRLDPARVTVNSLHPGSLLDTKMVHETFGRILGDASEGVDAELHVALSPELAGVTGEYFDRTTRARAKDQAYDAEARRTLWLLSEQLTGLPPMDPVESSSVRGS